MDTISGTFLNAARDNLASDVTATGGKMTLILKSLSDFRTRWTGAATKQRLKLLSRRTNQRLQRHLALTLKRRKTAQAASFGCGGISRCPAYGARRKQGRCRCQRPRGRRQGRERRRQGIDGCRDATIVASRSREVQGGACGAGYSSDKGRHSSGDNQDRCGRHCRRQRTSSRTRRMVSYDLRRAPHSRSKGLSGSAPQLYSYRNEVAEEASSAPRAVIGTGLAIAALPGKTGAPLWSGIAADGHRILPGRQGTGS